MQIIISKQLTKSPCNSLRPILSVNFVKGAGGQVKPKGSVSLREILVRLFLLGG